MNHFPFSFLELTVVVIIKDLALIIRVRFGYKFRNYWIHTNSHKTHSIQLRRMLEDVIIIDKLSAEWRCFADPFLIKNKIQNEGFNNLIR